MGGMLLVALLVALLALPTAGPAQAATPSSYSFSQQFAVADPESQQGLAYAGGLHYVSFDLGSGNGRIVAYDSSGSEVERTGVLPLGHANEVSYRTADGNLYVTNSTDVTPVVDVVDMRPNPPVLVKKIPVAGMTHGAVVGVDNANDQLVMATGPTGGPYSLVFTTMTGSQVRKVAIPDQGITQGLEVVDGQILLYTSLSGPARNQITVFSSSGDLLRVIPVPVASEGEGLSVDPATNRIHVGAAGPNRMYAMSPAFVPEPLHTSRMVTLTPVADTMARQQAPTTASGSLTTLGVDREETSGTASRETAYLRFTVPALASGESIVGASLSLQVTGATADGPAIWRTATTWDEDTLTWASGQPARTSTSSVGNFGSMSSGRQVGTAVSGVTASGDVSFQLYADASDGMLFSSRETTTSTRPQLILTISTAPTATPTATATASTRTVTLEPVADTMARQQAPTTASGSVTTLVSDREETSGTASRATGYVKFTVPALASGESITGARLSLQVTGATADGPAIWRTATTWDEDTLTWASGQPARTSTSSVGNFGTMNSGRQVGTAVSGVTASGDVSFQLYADANDGLAFSSRETTTSTRPQLVLTISTN